VVEKEISLDAALSACRYVQFSLTDLVRQLQGQAFGALGLDPVETPYRIISSGSFWRVRDYSELNTGQPLLVVAAPIKRPYIWDLTPSTSAIRSSAIDNTSCRMAPSERFGLVAKWQRSMLSSPTPARRSV